MNNEFDKKCDCMILNFWPCTNYGAILTCYGVKCLMEKLGKETKVINYFPKAIFRNKYKNSFTENFAIKNLNLTAEVTNYEDFRKLNNYADIFIAGSDQIWNSEIARTHHINATDGIYLLDFVKNTKKKISYSASFGAEYFNGNETEREMFSHFLNRFDGISVREDSGVEIAKNDFQKKAVQMIDGVFHIPQEKLGDLTKKGEQPEKYIGCYVLPYFTKNKWYEDQLEAISQSLNLPIKTLPFNSKTSVEEWLSFIKYSELIITDSYHATVFSIIFNKPFIQIVNAPTQNRFESLYRLLNIKNPSLDKNDAIFNAKNIADNFDWDNINNNIRHEVEKAEIWIREILSKQKEYNCNDDTVDYIVTNLKIKEQILNEIIVLLANKYKIYLKYYEYKLFSKIMPGKEKRKYYKFKKEVLKTEISKIREYEKQGAL